MWNVTILQCFYTVTLYKCHTIFTIVTFYSCCYNVTVLLQCIHVATMSEYLHVVTLFPCCYTVSMLLHCLCLPRLCCVCINQRSLNCGIRKHQLRHSGISGKQMFPSFTFKNNAFFTLNLLIITILFRYLIKSIL